MLELNHVSQFPYPYISPNIDVHNNKAPERLRHYYKEYVYNIQNEIIAIYSAMHNCSVPWVYHANSPMLSPNKLMVSMLYI